jgi:hypothetical protein
MDDTTIVGTRVAIVDEHEVVRAGLESWIESQQPDLIPVGSFVRPAEFLAWLPGAPGLEVVVTEIQENGQAADLDGLRVLCAAVPAVVVHCRASMRARRPSWPKPTDAITSSKPSARSATESGMWARAWRPPCTAAFPWVG